MAGRPPYKPPGALFARLVVAVGGLKVLVALASVVLAVATGAAGDSAGRAALLLAHALAFGIAGLLLLVGGRADLRAGHLGAVFVLVASAFSDSLVAPLWPRPSPWVATARAVLALQVDAFTPYFMWAFAREFPRAPSTAVREQWFGRVIRACLVLGAVLFAANAWAAGATLAPGLVPPVAALAYLSRHAPDGAYWVLQLGLVMTAMATLSRRARRAPLDERRRVALLAAALLVGATPTLVWTLLEAIPGFREAVPLRVAGWVIYPTLLATPFATAYAVLVHRALDVRVVVRRALRYALARYTLLAAAALPFAALAGAVYRDRDVSIADLLSSPRGATLVALALLAFAALRGRGALMTRLDRMFFPEQRRAEDVLGELVPACSRTRDQSELAGVLRAALGQALHPHALHVFFRDDRRGMLAAAGDGVPPVDLGGTLGMWLTRLDRSTDVDLGRPGAAPPTLGPEDRAWLADAGARLLVPVRDAGGKFVGLLALGEKKNELPYTKEDRALLGAVAGASAMALASYWPPAGGPPSGLPTDPADDGCAAECPKCGLVYAHGVPACDGCDVATRAAMLPLTVGGKFTMHQRIGAGAMGVVYRGVDLTLGRTVALKTLPFISAEDTERMRREARAMAAVTHANLALIYSAEEWQDRPMLVVEYLGGGTLADRLADGPLAFDAWAKLGIALATGLAALHCAGIVHGDVKPSNIGFAADGTPKLLDFGLAHVLPAGEPGPTPSAAPLARAADGGWDVSASRSIAFGTPHYMAPEAYLRARPAAVDDLWSVCVVLYEAVTGRRPFDVEGAAAIDGAPPAGPDLRPFAHAGMVEVAALFRDGLATDASQRPASAELLRDRLLRLPDR